jgi:hypothetical protein
MEGILGQISLVLYRQRIRINMLFQRPYDKEDVLSGHMSISFRQSTAVHMLLKNENIATSNMLHC